MDSLIDRECALLSFTLDFELIKQRLEQDSTSVRDDNVLDTL